MKRIFVSAFLPIIALFTLNGCVYFLPAPSPADEPIQPGNRRLLTGDHDAAVSYYSRLLRRHPTTEAYTNRGAAHFMAGRMKEAINDYSQALKLDGSNLKAYNNRGVVYYRLNDMEQAVRNFETALSIEPNYFIARKNLEMARAALAGGNAATETGEVQIVSFKITRSPEKDYLQSGNLCMKQRHFDCAVSEYTHGLEKGADARLYTNRGAAYYEKGMFRQAIADFNQALRVDPNDAKAYNNRGNAHFRLGNFEAAVADYDKAASLKSGYTAALTNRRMAARKLAGSSSGTSGKAPATLSANRWESPQKAVNPVTTTLPSEPETPPRNIAAQTVPIEVLAPRKPAGSVSRNADANVAPVESPRSSAYPGNTVPSFSTPEPEREPKTIIHVGSYRNRENAEKLFRDILSVSDRRAVIQKVFLPGNGEWYRVYVKTDETAEAAVRFGRRLKGMGVIDYFSVIAS